MITFIIILFLTTSVSASEAYIPLKGSPERKAILDALREGLKRFPDEEPSGIGFEYKKKDAGVKWFFEEGEKVIFVVNYLKVKDNWAWLEVAVGSEYGTGIDSLLHKKEGKWVVQGLVQPSYALCLNEEECVDVKAYIYKRFMEKFSLAPPEIFPKVDLERRPILNSLRGFAPELDLIFVVKHFKVKNRWAWIETNPRSRDGWGQYEPIDALFYKEKGKWIRKHTKPCCAEWEEDPKWKDVKGIEGYYRKLMQMFPGVTRDLFPK